MSAYAALVSLLQILETILHSSGLRISDTTRAQLRSLHEKVIFLLDFLESSSSTSALEARMRKAAYKAEDVLELQISRVTLPRRGILGNDIMNALCYIFVAYLVVPSRAVTVSYPDLIRSVLVVVAVSTAIAEFARLYDRVYNHSGVNAIIIPEMTQEIELLARDIRDFDIIVDEVKTKIDKEAEGVDPKMCALISLRRILDSILGSGGRRVSRNRAELECLHEKVSSLLGNASADLISNLQNLDAAVYMANIALFEFQFPDNSGLDFQWRRLSTLMTVSLHKLLIFPIALIFMIIRFIHYHTSLQELIPICLEILRHLCILCATNIIRAAVNLIIISAARYNSEAPEKRELRDAIDKFSTIENDVVENANGIPSAAAAAFSRQDSRSTDKDVVVGLDSKLIEIKYHLLQHSSNRELVPIVGMGGIGKTTLARQAYKDPDILTHFDVRAWVTVSQKYSFPHVLVCLLDSSQMLTEESRQDNAEVLGLYLHHYLTNRRYLIVMDDVWDTEIWDSLSRFLPNNFNGSRVLLTSRLPNVVSRLDSSSLLHDMQCLDGNQSWRLLREKIFGEEVCSLDLESIGKEIATSCKGLPLAIVVIGGLLHKDIPIEAWRDVADKLKRSESLGIKKQCLEIIGLSYSHLPHHLRPCLLYMGVFLGDCEIPISRLINLWVAEGFLKPCASKTLEDVAEGYLKDLTDRNLISICKRSCNGKIRTCSIHHLLRDVCVQNAREENFLHVVDSEGETPDESPRRLRIHRDALRVNATHVYDSVRSIFCIAAAEPVDNLLVAYLGFVCLRVLDVLEVRFVEFPHQILKLVLLRYLALHYDGPLPSSISELKYLETIVHHHSSSPNYPLLPNVIWSMSNLRHLYVKPGCYLFNPLRYRFLPSKFSFLPHLQTLVGIINFKWTKDIIAKIPNLKKLGISYHVSSSADLAEYQLETLVYLHRLETLKIIIKYDDDDDDDDDAGPTTSDDPPVLAFPEELIKLSLSGCRLPWESMTAIGALPNLKVLKLRRKAFCGPSWETVEGEFPQLVSLLLEEISFTSWETNEACFPCLERLILRSCHKLEEIPYGIGDIQTLEMIHLADCHPSAVASAKVIREDQEYIGNETLKLVIERKREAGSSDARGVGPRAFQIVRDYILNAGIQIIVVVSILIIRWPFLSNKLKCLLGSDACVLLFSFL